MHVWQQALWCIELAIHKRRVEDQLRLGIADLGLAPRFDLALHRLEVPLDAVNSNGEGIDQVEALGVLCQDRREHIADGQGDGWMAPASRANLKLSGQEVGLGEVCRDWYRQTRLY
jgi:hypothetical protein